ncbi:hypothetical protein [Luteimonas sp. A478]
MTYLPFPGPLFPLQIIEQPTVGRIIIELTEGEAPLAESVARLARA